MSQTDKRKIKELNRIIAAKERAALTMIKKSDSDRSRIRKLETAIKRVLALIELDEINPSMKLYLEDLVGQLK